MQVYGVDLAAWYAAGRWVALIDFIDGLPTACRLNEAVANDPVAAKYLAELSMNKSGDEDPWSPRTSEFDLTATLLRDVVNELKRLTSVTISAAGSKPGEVKPFPAPVTAIDRAMKAAARSWTEDFVQQFGFSPEDI